MSEKIYFQLPCNQLPDILVADIADVKPPYVHFKRQSNQYILYFIESGELFLREGNTQYHLQKNDLLLLDPSRTHAGIKSSKCRFFYFHFNLKDINEQTKEETITLLRSHYEKIQHFTTVDDADTGLMLAKYYPASTSTLATQILLKAEGIVNALHSNSLYGQAKANALLYELLLQMVETTAQAFLHTEQQSLTRIKQTIPELLLYLNQSYSENISSIDLEERFHCNFDYLNRLFKRNTGQTIFHYLNDLRIERAKQLLATGLYTVSEVASRTGFRDIYYFSRVFKKCTSTTPSNYQKCAEKIS